MKYSANITTKLIAFHERLAARTADMVDLEKLLKAVLGEVTTLVGASSGSIMVHDPALNRLRLYVSARHPGRIGGRSLPSGTALPVDEGIAGKVFRENAPVIVTDRTKAGESLPWKRRRGGGGFMSLPLCIQRRVIGVLNLNGSPDREGFTDEDVRLVTSLTGSVAALVEKGRLLEEVRRAHDETQRLYDLAVLLSRDEAVETLLGEALRKISGDLEAGRAAVIRFSLPSGHGGEEQPPEIVAAWKFGAEHLKRLSSAVGTSLRTELSLSKRARRADQLGGPPVSLPFRDGKQVLELFCLPLVTIESDSFVLCAIREPRRGDPEAARRHYRFLSLAARQIATALERAEMIEQLRIDKSVLLENALTNEIFLSISTELASTLDPHLVLRKAFDHFNKLVPYTTFTIMLFDEIEQAYHIIVQPSRRLAPAYLRQLREEVVSTFREYPAEPSIDAGRAPMLDVFHPQNPTPGAPAKFRQSMQMPVVLNGKITGMVHLSRVEDVTFGRSDFNKLSQFTAIFVTSIKNALIHKRTEKLAFTDPLTGLYNHRYFQETLLPEFIRSRRYDKPLSLMIIDIDHFKKFNDTWGHLTGDKVLIHVGQVFERSVRSKIDTVARYGGEEFAILLPETPLKGAHLFAERVRAAVEASPVKADGKTLPVTISIGVACTLVTNCTKTSDLIAAADSALYAAKDAGRNQVKTFESEHLEHV
ncbi:MAG TPA: sensor domain-containing diguanylate cyclase [Candidatus Ozemobacteraceae bacterium]|nr:sensor domain-containing diguanylate cyclase [Candidatus Ozemobacteraceae bacterium]